MDIIIQMKLLNTIFFKMQIDTVKKCSNNVKILNSIFKYKKNYLSRFNFLSNLICLLGISPIKPNDLSFLE